METNAHTAPRSIFTCYLNLCFAYGKRELLRLNQLGVLIGRELVGIHINPTVSLSYRKKAELDYQYTGKRLSLTSIRIVKTKFVMTEVSLKVWSRSFYYQVILSCHRPLEQG